MWNLIKKYFDIFGGFVLGIILSALAKFKLDRVQLIYSVIILILVCIGLCRLIRITANNNSGKPKRKRKERKRNAIDKVVDSRKEIKAIEIAQNPLKQGEELYVALKESRKDFKKMIKKLEKFFDKFKGWILAISLTVLSIVSQYGGFVDDLFDGKLVVGSVNIISLITLISAVVVGLLSDTHTKEQIIKIKEMFKKTTTNEIVIQEIKNQIKTNTNIVKELEKKIENENIVLDGYEKELEQAKNTYNAKIEMLNMIPQLATESDVQIALDKVNDINVKIDIKKNEIVELEKKVFAINSTLTALKSRLE